MNENLERWLNFLATTTLPQTTGQLLERGFDSTGEPETAYCCLGIGEGLRRGMDNVPAASLATQQFGEWLGIGPSQDPRINFPDDMRDRDGALLWHTTCSRLNDDLRLSFPQIADTIRYFGLRA